MIKEPRSLNSWALFLVAILGSDVKMLAQNWLVGSLSHRLLFFVRRANDFTYLNLRKNVLLYLASYSV